LIRHPFVEVSVRRVFWLIGLTVVSGAAAQAQATPAKAAAAPAPEAEQIAAAVLPLPAEFRATARVMGYRAGNPRLVTIRQGAGPFVCLATDPAVERFHVACYHSSLEPFMERGRSLRASGTTGEKVDTVRFAEVKSGKLVMPKQPAALYSLSGGTFDAAAGAIPGATPLFVIYIPGATAESTGLSAKPQQGAPWIMFPGTPKAHIMLVPKM
jgi:hypothetical protein